MKKIKIMVVDDHDFFRKSLILSLRRIKDVEVVAEAGNGQEFLHNFKNFEPDVVFMDIKMPLMNGIEATRQAVALNQYLNIIALTMHDDKEYFFQMMKAGAKGYIFKDTDEYILNDAIQTVCNGNYYYPEQVINNIFKT